MLTKDTPKKLFLLDAMALIYRAYFAFAKNPRINSKGLNTSAMFGFTNTLVEILVKEKPTHIAVAFDTAAPTERHTGFEGYKANRQAMPEDLAASIPYIYKIIEAFNVSSITADGYEADDIIGTLAKRAEKSGYITYMMTPDKDFAQLVSENIFIYKPARLGNDVEILGVEEVLKKYEITNVLQVIDLLGLWGDAVDNIPGIPGVGEKTAKQLIAQFGSMENMIANSHQIQGKLKDKVIAHSEQGLMSKALATILLDVPLDLHVDELAYMEPNKEMLRELFAELEFKNFAKRILGDDTPAPSSKAEKTSKDDSSQGSLFDSETVNTVFKTIKDVEHEYILVDTAEKRAELVKELAASTSFCFDTETTGTDANQAELVGLSFCLKPGVAYYIPVPEVKAEADALVAEFKALLENENIEKIGQNIKYDILMLLWYGVQVKGKLFDTMLAHYLIDPDTRHNMDYMSETMLGYQPISITELIGKKGKEQGSMRDVAIPIACDYAAEDADITMQLKYVLNDKLDGSGIRKLFEEVENPLVYVLADMEKEGIALDTAALKEYSKQLEGDIAKLEDQIYTKTGERFNIASPKQLGEVLFEKMKLDPKAKKTKTGQYQTGEDILLNLAHEHDVVQDILDFRQFSKLKSTYVDALPLMVNPKTGRVHSSFNQAVAATGRLSSNNPNLQNIPIKTEKGREVRKAFIPSKEGHVLLSADYSQIELRIVASISEDEGMIEAFTNGEDIHRATAAKVYNVATADVSSEMRRNAKAVNFGIIYGQSAFGLSQSLGIPRKEAAEIIESYFKQYPRIKQYMSTSMEFARENGYVQTLLGRRRYLRDINSANATVRSFAERNAINAPIQGSAADMIKVAMIRVYNALQAAKLETKMILQVHDELVFDVPQGELEIVKKLVVEEMQNAIPLKVPVVAESGSGRNWLEAH